MMMKRVVATTTTTNNNNIKKFSGLQKEVFGLYRTILREAASKDRQSLLLLSSKSSKSKPSSSSVVPSTSLLNLWFDTKSTSYYARNEFRTQAKINNKNDFRTIEYKIRHGYKQIKILKMPGTKVVSSSSSS